MTYEQAQQLNMGDKVRIKEGTQKYFIVAVYPSEDKTTMYVDMVSKHREGKQTDKICKYPAENLELISAQTSDEEILAHAKALKEYCAQRDNSDDVCEGCPFHFYRGTNGQCILNDGLYPNEWYKPNKENNE